MILNISVNFFLTPPGFGKGVSVPKKPDMKNSYRNGLKNQLTIQNKNDKELGMKKVFKILAFLGGLVFIITGLGTFLTSLKYGGWGVAWITWGILMIWYWKKG